VPGDYEVVAYDAASNRLVTFASLTVAPGAAANCTFAVASIP
jgi:hypothetical protein